MIATSIHKRWLTDELKPDAVDAVRKGLKSRDDRVRQAALKAFLAMEAQNQKDEHKLLDAQLQAGNDRLAAVAADLGIDPDLIVDRALAPPAGVEGDEQSPAVDGTG